MGSHPDRGTFHNGTEFCDDHERVRKIFQAVPLYCHSTDTAIDLWGRTFTEYRKEFLEILCGSLLGGSDHRACVHHLFAVRIFPARN